MLNSQDLIERENDIIFSCKCNVLYKIPLDLFQNRDNLKFICSNCKRTITFSCRTIKYNLGQNSTKDYGVAIDENYDLLDEITENALL